MSKNTWDAVLASAPLNATAGRVTAKGEEFVPQEMNTGHCWEDLPELREITAAIRQSEGFLDLTGQSFGRLTVVGLLAENTLGKGSIWVCRCKCGRYSGNRGKTLKAGKRDRCDHCDHTQRLALFASGDNARRRASDVERRRWQLP